MPEVPRISRKKPIARNDDGPSQKSSRGDWIRTFVNEKSGLHLALSVFPEVYEFPGEAVLALVEPGLYKKKHGSIDAKSKRTS
jgi:hypothetical protein